MIDINLLKDIANITIYKDGIAGGKYQDRNNYGKTPFESVRPLTVTVQFYFDDETVETAQIVGEDFDELNADFTLAKDFIKNFHRHKQLKYTNIINVSAILLQPEIITKMEENIQKLKNKDNTFMSKLACMSNDQRALCIAEYGEEIKAIRLQIKLFETNFNQLKQLKGEKQ